MRKSITIILTVLAATVLLLTGCDPILPSGEKKVKFKATSRNQVTTKTVYAGAATGSTHEDIYWDDNDEIRIYSSDLAVVSTPSGGGYANYELNVSTDKTKAELDNPANSPNGLVWNQQNSPITFYAVYPPTTRGNDQGWFTMTIPSQQSYATLTGTDMSNAYMLAQNTLEQLTNEVSLDFYPAFIAFQINLKSKDEKLTLKQFRIYSVDDSNHLAGEYNGRLKPVPEGEDQNDFFAYNADKSLRMDFGYASNNLQNEVCVEFPFDEDADTGTKTYTKSISTTNAVDFTLLTLPYGIDGTEAYNVKPYLTNLWLEISYWKDGTAQTDDNLIKKRLALTQEKEFLQFGACKKYRINGLAVGGSWRLAIDGKVLPWTGYEQTVDQQVSLQGKVEIAGTIESTKAWQQDTYDEQTGYWTNTAGQSKDNHYADSDWAIGGTSGYDKHYQLRYLNRDLPADKRYFTMTFKPTAPTGGYWQLIPTFKEGDTESPKHFRFEVDLPGGGKSDQLKGQILNSEVTIRIYPKDYSVSDVNIYDVWFKCFFSPSANFNPSISADSEFQDVHGDGRFSYWVLRLAQYEGGPFIDN